MHMNTKKYRSRLLAQHNMQVKLFDRSVAAVVREFAEMDEADTFLTPLREMADTLWKQTTAAEGIIKLGDTLAGEPSSNRSPAFMAAGGGPLAYDFLSNNRKLVEQVGDLDEWSKALALDYELQQKARPFMADPEIWNVACNTSWRLGACQAQIHALARSAQAITASQEALFRAYGLMFWQGHKRYLRWEGDSLSASWRAKEKGRF